MCLQDEGKNAYFELIFGKVVRLVSRRNLKYLMTLFTGDTYPNLFMIRLAASNRISEVKRC